MDEQSKNSILDEIVELNTQSMILKLWLEDNSKEHYETSEIELANQVISRTKKLQETEKYLQSLITESGIINEFPSLESHANEIIRRTRAIPKEKDEEMCKKLLGEDVSLKKLIFGHVLREALKCRK